MKEYKPKVVSTEDLERVSGGQHLYAHDVNDVCFAIGDIYYDYVQVNPPKYPCPECGSWDVGNYDPGVIYQMRVYCKKCGFFGCRDGYDDELWGELIQKRLKKRGLIL